MSLAAMTGVGVAPPSPEGDALRLACIDAATLLASKSAGATSAQEAKDFAAAVLHLSQAIAVQSPDVDASGVPLAHHRELAALSKPEPAEAAKRKRLRLTRDNEGRATGAEVEEG